MPPYYIPPFKAIREAYYCLLHCWQYHLLIAYLVTLPYTIAGLLGGLDPLMMPTTSLDAVPAGYYSALALMFLTVAIWPIPCVVLWQRLYLLGPSQMLRKRFWPLLTRTVQFVIVFLISFGCIMALGGIVLFLMMTLITPLLDRVPIIENVEVFTMGIAAALLMLVMMVASVRLGLLFVSQAIGRQMSFRQAWQVTQGNTVRMISVSITGFVPMLALFLLVVYGLRQVICPAFMTLTLSENTSLNFLLLFAFSPVLTLPLAYLAAQMSVFYRCLGVGSAWMDSFLKAGTKSSHQHTSSPQP
ncbi:MAG: hypothetical protein CMF31_04560 [Kordiimonas sp.]|nr:hypothetical protein [Kordiimonas sp.]|tara:strand:+ start:1889 stop:2791 length:903 start_codon:yes stop_codon:yes gene_type:complete